MKLGKNLAIFCSVIFFFVLSFIVIAIVINLFPDFSFSENPIMRLIGLVVLVYITKRFYIYLKAEES
ncbi:hypothetical protein [Methanobrevibacter sp.]|uniref:hypothetical protein n=1 Tax=Methanobrevibacter sp. TaxID=66852 RepID=UPI00260D591B|nr:hypothetical protein [uncultured Methanobrevibacter sp.]